MSRKFDLSISFIRVMAMLFIVLCHLSSHYGITATAQFFNVGVPIFFMISGYLYGNKRVGEPVLWLYNRYIRLIIPALMWLLLRIVLSCFHEVYIPCQQDVLMLLLNLHGINFVFTQMPDLGPGPWFFSSIMCCYILLLVYLKTEEKHKNIYKLFNYGGVYPLAIFVVLALVGISTDGALAFFIGFVLRRNGVLEKTSIRLLLNALLAFSAAILIRLITKRFLDETLVYKEVIAPWSHVILALSFLVGVKWFFGVCPKIMNPVVDNKVFGHIDRISIYVYVCHDQLFGILDWNIPIPVIMLMYIVSVLLVSTVAWAIGSALTSKIDKLVQYCFA